MITDPAYPSPRDNDKAPHNGFSKLEVASLQIFCAVLANPAVQQGPDLSKNMDACIDAAAKLLTKIEAAKI